MSLEDLGNLGDFVGGLAVIATLLYLAIQIRQNSQQIAQNSEWLRAQASRADQADLRATTSLLAIHPDLARIFSRGSADPDALEPEEWLRFVPLMGLWIGNYQSSHYDWTKGLIEDGQWNNHLISLRAMLRTPGGRRYWESFASHLPPAFQRFVTEEILSDQPPAA